MDSFEHAPVREGDVLANKYKVERVLGVGGMGIVVAARHIELDQRVALKFLLPAAMASEEMVGRFLNEGRAAVRLRSEHVAKVLDVGRLEDGAPYIVMEYLDGRDLGAVIKEHTTSGTLSIEDAAGYVLQACEAVAEAHAAKIIHRDLKPQNLFLTRGLDGESLVKVLDFGISKTIAPPKGTPGSDGLTLTRTQSMLGSPLYMSPEQMRSSKNVDARSDIWSFGVILFELLTGRVPFEAENMPELVFKIAENDAPDPRSLRADIPPALSALIMRCLQKDVDKRFANIGELATALEPFASERERGLALRATLVLGGSLPRARAASLPDGGPVPLSSSGGAVAASTPALASTGATSDAWSGTRAQDTVPSQRRPPSTANKPFLTYVIAGVAAVGIAVGVVAFSRMHSNHDDVQSAAPPPPVTATIPTPTATTATSAAAATTMHNDPMTHGPVDVSGAGVQLSPSAPTAPIASNSAGSAIATRKPSGAITTTNKVAPPTTTAASAASATKPATASSTSTASAAPANAAGGFIQVRE